MDDALKVLDEAIAHAWGGELDAAMSMINSVSDRVPMSVIGAVNLTCVNIARMVGQTSKDEYVYVLKEGDYVKIGCSVNPKQRVQTYSTHSPRPMELVAYLPPSEANEAALHTRFARYRERGEWFRLEGELLEWVNGLKSALAA